VVGLELAEVPDSANGGRPPTLPCSDIVVRVAALALTLALPLSSRRWRKCAVPNMMLRASTTKTPLHQVAFSGIMAQLPTSIVDYLW